jgi:[ribosomal protein S18]-alanine N-acetyltransferase
LSIDVIYFDPAELEQLVSLERDCFSCPPNAPWGASDLGSFFSNPYSFSIGLLEGRVVVSYLIASVIAADAEILRIGTRPAFQSRGYARTLLELATKQWQESGVESVWLEVRESNAAARALYANLGFTLVRRRIGYYPIVNKLEPSILGPTNLETDSFLPQREDGLELALALNSSPKMFPI